MAAIHETAYPRLKSHWTQKELNTLFSPTDTEIQWLNSNTKHTLPVSRLGCLMLFKCYQCLGYPIAFKEVDPIIKKHIARAIQVDPNINLDEGYSRMTRNRHLKNIREYLKISADTVSRRKVMKQAAMAAATTKENLADIINCIIEELIRLRFELPSFYKLVRLARATRTVTNNRHYEKINQALSQDQKSLIDKIIGKKECGAAETIPHWRDLKYESKKPTTKKVRLFLNSVEQLQQLHQQLYIDVSEMKPARLESLRDEAISMDAAYLKKLRPIKRYALVTVFIYMKASKSIDDVVDILIKWIKQIDAQAKSNLEAYRIQEGGNIDELIRHFYNTLLAIDNNEKDREKIAAIEHELKGKQSDLIDQCKTHLGLTTTKHLSWIKKPYKKKRHVLFELLDRLKIFSATQDKSIEAALAFIQEHRHSRQEWLDIKEDDLVMQAHLASLPAAWHQAVTGKTTKKPVKSIHRHYYELATLTMLAGELTCADAFVENSYQYDDPNKQYISWEAFHNEVDPYCERAGLTKNPSQFIEHAKQRLKQAAQDVDDHYLNNPHLVLHDGLLSLKKLEKKKEHPKTDSIRQQIMSKMPTISILDAMIEVERWLQLSLHFKPLSGNESRIPDYPPRFSATMLSYGCNLGPTQAERSLSKFTRKQIAWLFKHHASDQKLIQAIQMVIDRYNLLRLPKHWGPGDSASADGTFWDMYKQNLLAAHHIRYGRYGGVGYYHVSDQYIALFSEFISCGAHESIYLLNGIVENDSDIQAKKLHGDSWAQSEVLFGLSSLMGISIMPRIKQLKHLNFYKASPKESYTHINALFTEKALDFNLVETHYHDMLRIVISIYKGKLKPSTLLRRLCSKSRKNKLYYAFRELGRIERTIFSLQYIDDSEMRRTIHAATCKSEEFNQFIKWIRFGDGGVIQDNMAANQKKILRFGHLLANMLVFHTAASQTKAINKLRGEGVEIPDQVLADLSPYWTENINRYGMFELNTNRAIEEIEYDLIDN